MPLLTTIEDLMDPREGIIKLCKGNPGALSALSMMVMASAETDPDSAFGATTPLITLDEMAIYGSDIWILFKDVCKQDVTVTLAMLRATQLGLLTHKEVKAALTQGRCEEKTELQEKADGIVEAVQERLPNFAKNPTVLEEN